MTQKIDFKNIEKDFFYAVAPHTKARVKFGEMKNAALENEYNEAIGDYDYISVISREKFTEGAELEIDCYFEGMGAPCIVFTDDVEEKDFSVYGIHFEVCIYKDGVNVWHIVPCPERVERPIRPTKIYFEEWKVNEKGVHCSVKFGKKSITVSIEGRTFTVTNEDFPEKFRVGFTACEGLCGFTDFKVKA